MEIADSVSNSLNGLVSDLNAKEDRDYSYLHPSEIGECHRRVYYRTIGTKPMVPPGPQMLRIFGNGHFVHLRYQLYLRDAGILAKEKVAAVSREMLPLGLTDLERVIVIGATGRKYHYDPMEWVWLADDGDRAAAPIAGMNRPNVIRAGALGVEDEIWMVEVPLFDQEFHFGGHADAIVRTPQGAAVIDFKSTNENGFAKLFKDEARKHEYNLSYPHPHFQTCHICGDDIRRWQDYNDHLMEQHLNHFNADPKHKIQVNLYMWMLGVGQALVLYENKNTQLVMCHPVERDETLIAQIKSDAVDVWRHILAKDPPGRPYQTRSKYPCAYCDFVSNCWSSTTHG